MNTTALLFSTALAFAANVQDAAPQPGQVEDQDSAQAQMGLAQDSQTPPADLETDPLDVPIEIEPVEGQLNLADAANRAEAYLRAMTTMRARFEQIAADQTLTTGVLEIARPGRARFDYDDPNPVLVVADGATVAIADFDLETIDRAPIGATPLRFLLDEELNLVATGAVIDASRYDGRLYVSLEDPEGEVEGRLTLVFDDPDPDNADQMVFAGWYAIDALGGLTEVRLTQLETGMRISPRQFILDDEDVIGGDDRRRRRGR